MFVLFIIIVIIDNFLVFHLYLSALCSQYYVMYNIMYSAIAEEVEHADVSTFPFQK